MPIYRILRINIDKLPFIVIVIGYLSTTIYVDWFCICFVKLQIVIGLVDSKFNSVSLSYEDNHLEISSIAVKSKPRSPMKFLN